MISIPGALILLVALLAAIVVIASVAIICESVVSIKQLRSENSALKSEVKRLRKLLEKP